MLRSSYNHPLICPARPIFLRKPLVSENQQYPTKIWAAASTKGRDQVHFNKKSAFTRNWTEPPIAPYILVTEQFINLDLDKERKKLWILLHMVQQKNKISTIFFFTKLV